MKYTLPAQIIISDIELTIQDLNRSIEFYSRVIGLDVRTRNQYSAELGTKTTPLVRLHEKPKAQKTSGTTGLYHFAILVPQRRILAKSLKNIIETQTPVQGFADHGVSEAIYLPDPDGNGIEIYRDRPYQEWPFNNGELQMVTDPLDVENLLMEINGNNGQRFSMPEQTTIGHIHLHVRDIPEAVRFYQDVLGFDLKQRYGPSAAFLAAGDYHHHIGINTWTGVGAPPPAEGSIGLRSFSIALPNGDSLRRHKEHIHQSGVKVSDHQDSFTLQDPSGNQIIFKLAS